MTENIISSKKIITTPKQFIAGFKSVLVETLCCPESQLTLNANLTYMGLDSLDILEIIMRLERKFDVNLADSEFTTYTNITVQDLLTKFASKLIEIGRFPKRTNITTMYQKLLSATKAVSTIKQTHKNTPQKALVDEYNAAATKLPDLEHKMGQHQK